MLSLILTGQIDKFKEVLFDVLFNLASFKGCISRVHLSVFFWSNVKNEFEFNQVRKTFFENNCSNMLMLKFSDLNFILSKLKNYLKDYYKIIFDGIESLFLSKQIVIPLENLCNFFSCEQEICLFDIDCANEMLIETNAEYLYKIQKFIDDRLLMFKKDKIEKLLPYELRQQIDCLKRNFEKLNTIQIVEFIQKYAKYWKDSDFYVLVWCGYCTNFDLNQAINIYKRRKLEDSIGKNSFFCAIQKLCIDFHEKKYFFYSINELKIYLKENKILEIGQIEKLNRYIDFSKVICFIQDLLTADEILELTVESINEAELISQEALSSLIKSNFLLKLRFSDLNKFHLKTINCNQLFCKTPSKLINYDKLIKVLKIKLDNQLHVIIDKSIDIKDRMYTNDLVKDLIENNDIKFARLVRVFRKNILNEEKIKQLNELNLIRNYLCLEMNIFKEKFMKTKTNFNYVSKILVDYIESSWLEYGHLNYPEFVKYLNKLKYDNFTVNDLQNNSDICLFDEELIRDFVYLLQDVLKISFQEFNFVLRKNVVDVKNLVKLNHHLILKSKLDMIDIEKKVRVMNVVEKNDVINILFDQHELIQDALKIKKIISGFKKKNNTKTLSAKSFSSILKQYNFNNINEKHLNILSKLNVIDKKLKDDCIVFNQEPLVDKNSDRINFKRIFKSFTLNHAELPQSSLIQDNNQEKLISKSEWNDRILNEGVLELKRPKHLLENLVEKVSIEETVKSKPSHVQINTLETENKKSSEIKAIPANLLLDATKYSSIIIKNDDNIDISKKLNESSKNNQDKNNFKNHSMSFKLDSHIIEPKIQHVISKNIKSGIQKENNKVEIEKRSLNKNEIEDPENFRNEKFKTSNPLTLPYFEIDNKVSLTNNEKETKNFDLLKNNLPIVEVNNEKIKNIDSQINEKESKEKILQNHNSLKSKSDTIAKKNIQFEVKNSEEINTIEVVNSNSAILTEQVFQDNSNITNNLSKTLEKKEIKIEEPINLLHKESDSNNFLRISRSKPSLSLSLELESEPSQQDLISLKELVRSFSSIDNDVTIVKKSSKREIKELKSEISLPNIKLNSSSKKDKNDSKIDVSNKKIILKKHKVSDSIPRSLSDTKQKKLKNKKSLHTIKNHLKIKSDIEINTIKPKQGFSSTSG